MTQNSTLEFLTELADSLGYKLIRKEQEIITQKPKNAAELNKKSEDELKNRLKQIMEEQEATNKKLVGIREKLSKYFIEQGPTEFTKCLFSGTTIPSSRIIVSSRKMKQLDVELDYINGLLSRIRQKNVISNIEDVEEIEIGYGAMGPILKVDIA